MKIGDRIRERRQAQGRTLEEIADAIGISRQTMSRYETGVIGNIPSDKIEDIAAVLRTTPAYLMGWENTDLDDSDVAAGFVQMPKAGTVPLLGRIACGAGLYAEQNIEEYVPAPAHSKADFALRCQGDSMINARIFDGDTVYIKSQPDVDNGEIAAVLIGDEATLKKVYRTPDKLVLRAENPLYSDRVFTGEALDGVRILGKAVAFTSAVQHEVDRLDGEWRKYVGQPIAARGGGVKPMTEAQAKAAWKFEQNRVKTGR